MRHEPRPGPYGGGLYVRGGGSAAELAERLNAERVEASK